jgi:hypothetical protein
MRMRFAVALMMAISLLVASLSARASEQIDLAPTVKVLVISSDRPGHYNSRVGRVHEFSDAVIAVCFEQQGKPEAVDCFVITKDTQETLVVHMRIIGEVSI